MKKKYLWFSALFLFCVVVGAIIMLNISKVYIISTESYYSDFSINDQVVEIKCSVVVKNTYDTEKTVKLTAHFPDDVGVLLKESQLFAKNCLDNSEIFTLPANSKKRIDVVFVGDFAGTNKKHDRLLPKISIIEIT